jgi:hypothetical protein
LTQTQARTQHQPDLRRLAKHHRDALTAICALAQQPLALRPLTSIPVLL